MVHPGQPLDVLSAHSEQTPPESPLLQLLAALDAFDADRALSIVATGESSL